MMTMNNEVTEVCPFCEREITLIWNPDADGFKCFCPACGNRLMLCTACHDRGFNCDYCTETDTCRFNEKEKVKMRVLIIEPGKAPRRAEIEEGLDSLQSIVGGDIEVVYPFSDAVGIILNEEGKLEGLEPNRFLCDEGGHMYDYLAGTFIVAGLTEDSFGSLSDELAAKYSEWFSDTIECISGIYFGFDKTGKFHCFRKM